MRAPEVARRHFIRPHFSDFPTDGLHPNAQVARRVAASHRKDVPIPTFFKFRNETERVAGEPDTVALLVLRRWPISPRSPAKVRVGFQQFTVGYPASC